MALITPDLYIPDIQTLMPKTRRWSDVKPCGTLAAKRRHLRRGEPVDLSCRQAERRYMADYHAKLRALGVPNLGGRWPKSSETASDGVD